MDSEDEKPKGNLPAGMTPWKKGQSGNPKGRGKGVKNRSTIYRAVLDQVVHPDMLKKMAENFGLAEGTELTKDMTLGELVALSVTLKAAQTGSDTAAREAFDSAYGKITDKVESTMRVTQMGRVSTKKTVTERTVDGSASEKTVEEDMVFDIGDDPKSAEGYSFVDDEEDDYQEEEDDDE